MKTTAAKIALSDKELELVCNSEWILTKHAIIQKVYQVFGALQPGYEKLLRSNKERLPAAVFAAAPKIARGENYRQLPYVILDYPRCFQKEDTIAIRTLFWWGNFFSVSLQLSGRSLAAAIPHIEQSFEKLRQKDYWICINDQPWEHHFESDNYIQLNTITAQEFGELLQKPFLKIAGKISLHHWQDAPAFMVESFEELAGLLKLGA